MARFQAGAHRGLGLLTPSRNLPRSSPCDRASRSSPSLPCAAACALLASLGLLPAPAKAAQTPLLPTLTKNLDGTTTDIAGPADSSSAPEQKRVWIAEGRVRTAIRISDRQRMFAEDRSFSSSVSAQTYESLIAVEVDEVNQRLYTLTEDAIYREDISTPSSPTSLDYYDFSPATGFPVEQVISSWEPAVDLKVWPQGGGLTAILVLTNKRLITLLDSGPGTDIVLAGWTSDLYDPYIPEPDEKILPTDHCSPVDVATLKAPSCRSTRSPTSCRPIPIRWTRAMPRAAAASELDSTRRTP
jgi:hypothetical protein